MLFPEVETDLLFPLEGMDTTRAFLRQRKMTTASAQNVRSFEPATDRARGGQRHGLVRYFAGQAVGAFPIQDINHLVFGSGGTTTGQTNSGSVATPTSAPPPVSGQFVYALAAGSGFGVASGTNGVPMTWSPVGAVASFQFACSCWDALGFLYVAEVNQTTGATTLYKYQANGTLIWSVSGPAVATGANRNVCGMSANSTTGELFIAVIAAAAPLYRVWNYATADGSLWQYGSVNAPIIANDSTAAFSGKAANMTNANLVFSVACVNNIAVVNPAGTSSILGIDTAGGTTGAFIVVLSTNGGTAQTTYLYTGMAKSTAVRSQVVSDGNSSWYVLRSTTTHRLAKITVAGTTTWGNAITTYDAITPQGIAFDATGPNSLVVVGTATGALKSVNVVSVGSGGLALAVSCGAVATWNAVASDGKGNFTLWRDSVANTDIMGINNNLSTVWGPTTFANAVHSGASVSKVAVNTGNILTITTPSGSQQSTKGSLVSITCAATDSGGALALTWAATGLPLGLSIALSTGVISGTVSNSAAPAYTTTITATDSSGFSASVTVAWSIYAAGGTTVTVTNPGSLTATNGSTFSLTMAATDTDPTALPLTWFAVGLPPGLSCSTGGIISGTLTAGGIFNPVVYGTDKFASQGSVTFKLTIVGSGSTGAISRRSLGLVVSNGELRTFTAAGTVALTGGAGAMSTVAPVVWSSPCLQQMFYVDGAGYVYYDAPSNAVKTWVATAGVLPTDTLASPATLIALWRGRIVLSGLPNDPANWFMSAALAPFDFNYSPATTTTTQAMAGNNANAGQIGDVITCIIPYTDDTLIFGCTHSMWLLNGDPADGGQITAISHTLGMAWGRPFAIDPVGQVYFMGSDRHIYKIVPGALPVQISQAINRQLLNVDLAQNLVTMVWDMRNQGLGVFITPFTAGATTHFFWEQRTNSWWPQVFANTNHDPLAVHVWNSDSPGDEVVMFGSRDGFVRNWNESMATDDATPIASFVFLGPLMTQAVDFILLKDLHATLGTASGQVTWQVYVGDTAEAALASSPVASGTWSAGRNRIENVRRSGYVVYLKLSATTPWAIEKIKARYTPTGRVAARQLRS